MSKGGWRTGIQVVVGVVVAVLAWWLLDDIGTSYRLDSFGESQIKILWFALIGLVFAAAVLWSQPSALAVVATLAIGVFVGTYKAEWVPTQEGSVVPIDAIDLRLIVVRGAHDPALFVLIGVALAFLVLRRIKAFSDRLTS